MVAIAELATIAPNPWPTECAVDPNEFDLFAPRGNGIFGGSGVYGTQPQFGDPIKNGPLSDPNEGTVVYFDSTDEESLMGLMICAGIHNRSIVNPNRKYAVFHQQSERPGADGFFNQLRIVSDFGLKYGFRAVSDAEYDVFPKQTLSIPELIVAFVQSERKRLRGFLGSGGEDIGGSFGGDGDFAQEGVSFGLMVENGYHRIYRVWSRAWLITK